MKSKALVILICALGIFDSTSVIGQQKDSLYFTVDLPLFEYPYNSRDRYKTASINQAIAFSKSFYSTVHFGIEKFAEKRIKKNGPFWGKVIMTVFDFAPIPFSNTWLHEESHRAILTLHEIKSRNSYWSNSVTMVDDQDLVNFKSLHPSDLVREATAGNEGNLEFVFSIQKDVFYGKVNTWNYGLYWGNYLVNSFYLFGSSRKDSAPLVRFKNGESTDVHERDVNGFDPINATYDLFNPWEDYDERGIHPSGVGIDRYVEFQDLSIEAQRFLKNQFTFSLLNFVDLNLFGIDELGSKLKYNFSLRHHMTSFGYMLGANVFFKNEKLSGLISPKFYRNRDHSYPGAELELRNNWAWIKLAAWQQPANQLYADDQKMIGGLIELQVSPLLNNFQPYFKMSMKSEGWVAGNLYLDKNTSFWLGISWRVEG